MTPYQHGVVREITQHNRFDPLNPQFLGYRYTQHDLMELVESKVIRFINKSGIYVAGAEWEKAK